MLEITWTYLPPRFFEADLQIPMLDGTVSFQGGRVTYLRDTPLAADIRQFLKEATKHVRRILDARRLLIGGSYELSDPQFVEIDDTGKKHYTLLVESASHAVLVDSVDLIVSDKAGNVLRDTKTERIKAETAYVTDLSAKAARHPTLAQMLESFAQSYEDRKNALVHLYEVRDAAATHFGNKTAALRALNIPASNWNRLGELSNDLPLVEGRHRGKQQALRPATLEELDEARTLARSIIDAFAASL